MEFIRANFDQPDDFWDAPSRAADRRGAHGDVDPGAELKRTSTTSAAPAIAALQRLETGELPPTIVEAIRNTLNLEEMRMLQRRMPALFGKPGTERSRSASGLGDRPCAKGLPPCCR